MAAISTGDRAMKVGDTVILDAMSRFNDGSYANPVNLTGIIEKVKQNGMIEVLWSNGITNSYAENDLILHEEEPKGHQNAPILMEIAKEAAINPEYWKEFEWKDCDDIWSSTKTQTGFLAPIITGNHEIRRKPRTIRIGSYDVKYPEEIRISAANPNYVFINMGSVCNAELMLKSLQELLGAKQ